MEPTRRMSITTMIEGLRVVATGQMLWLAYETSNDGRMDQPRRVGVIDPDWPTVLALATDMANNAVDGIDVCISSCPHSVSDSRWKMLLTAGLRIRSLALRMDVCEDEDAFAVGRSASTATQLGSRRACHPTTLDVRGGVFAVLSEATWNFLHDLGLLDNPTTSSLAIGQAWVAWQRRTVSQT